MLYGRSSDSIICALRGGSLVASPATACMADSSLRPSLLPRELPLSPLRFHRVESLDPRREAKRREEQMILPMVKLGSLAFRTLSKPIASRLKRQAGNYPEFRAFIINLAQANHRFTTNIQRRLYGQATDVNIRPLNEEKAVHAAADLLGEVFVFLVAGAAIIFEVQRSARSEARKEELRKQELEALKHKDDAIANELLVIKEKLNELERLARGPGLMRVLGCVQDAESPGSKPTSS